MRFAYADPPYLGCGKKFYGTHHPEAAACDDPEWHKALLERLRDEYPDGWVLSLSSNTLEEYLHLTRRVFGDNCVRVGAWVKPFHVFKKGVRPAYAWEPVLYRGGRNSGHRPPVKGGKATTPRDWVAANITLRKGLTGAKPPAFCRWVFELLNIQLEDSLDDLFSGTGEVQRQLELWFAEKVAA